MSKDKHRSRILLTDWMTFLLKEYRGLAITVFKKSRPVGEGSEYNLDVLAACVSVSADP